MTNQSWNGWKFLTHCNNLEWVKLRNCSEGKNQFCTSSKRFYLKDNNKPSNWVGH